MNIIVRSTLSSLTLIVALLLGAGAANADPVTARQMQVLLDNPERSADDKARDEARKPAEVIAFMNIEPGMTIMDVMAASGWYTEVLSLATGPDGVVYAQNPAFMLEFMDGFNDKALTARLADGRLPNVQRVDQALADLDLADDSVDLVFTALNFHDTYYMAGEEAAAALLENIHRLLKPGGALILIDHAGQADLANDKLHRIPQQVVVDMALAAGFNLEAQGEMLRHPEDDGTQMVFAKDIRGKTDRFVLKLVK